MKTAEQSRLVFGTEAGFPRLILHCVGRKIRVYPKIRVLSSRIFTQTLDVEKFCNCMSIVSGAVNFSLVHTSNNVEATFDFIAFDNIALTMLLVWTGFRRSM